MVRTQVQLTVDQHRRLKRWAQQRGISLAEAVRRCVTEHLAEENSGSARADRVRDALATAGKYADSSGATDIAREHDAALADAYRR
jgi:hypothetical protein